LIRARVPTDRRTAIRNGLGGENPAANASGARWVQAMARCATTMEWAVDDRFAPCMFAGRILGSLEIQGA
jgi:hypothetical protein